MVDTHSPEHGNGNGCPFLYSYTVISRGCRAGAEEMRCMLGPRGFRINDKAIVRRRGTLMLQAGHPHHNLLPRQSYALSGPRDGQGATRGHPSYVVLETSAIGGMMLVPICAFSLPVVWRGYRRRCGVHGSDPMCS